MVASLSVSVSFELPLCSLDRPLHCSSFLHQGCIHIIVWPLAIGQPTVCTTNVALHSCTSKCASCASWRASLMSSPVALSAQLALHSTFYQGFVWFLLSCIAFYFLLRCLAFHFLLKFYLVLLSCIAFHFLLSLSSFPLHFTFY